MTEKFITNISRFMLGGVFLLFGLNGLFDFMGPLQTLEGEAAQKFMKGLNNAVYFLPFLRIVEASMGFFLVFSIYVPFALVVLMPVNLNIFLFNIFLNPGSAPLSIVMMVAHIYLLWKYKEHYKYLFKSKIKDTKKKKQDPFF